MVREIRMMWSKGEQLSTVVDWEVDNTTGIIDDVFDTWKANGSIKGLAAPQIGIFKRVILCRFGKIGSNPTVMINPVVKFAFGKKRSLEGCESIEGRYFVKRPRIGKVSWLNCCGHECSGWFSYKSMRIIMHEIDHLNGIQISTNGKRAIGIK